MESRAKPYHRAAQEASGIIKPTMIIRLLTQRKGVKPQEMDFLPDNFPEGDLIKVWNLQGSLQTKIESTQPEQKAAELKKDVPART